MVRLVEKEKQTYNNFPRTVESLCPECNSKIKATLSIQGNDIVMEKTCSEHGSFREVLSNDKDFFLRMEKLRFADGPGVTNPQAQAEKGCPFDCGLCEEHKSTTMMGVIDLTNRCNLKCPICYATADASGYIYEPSFEQVKEMMHNLFKVKPSHAPCMQFAGGEPTLHPQFLEIVKEARKIGFTQIQIATNGITLNDEEFAKKASEAGLNLLYLQFDGVTDDVYMKTRGKPLFEIKKKAIANAAKYGIRTFLVPTLVKGVNDHQIGDIYRFAVNNLDSVAGIAWQPVALTGRIPEEEKNRMRFTITDLAKETEKQFPILSKNDFFPLGLVPPFSLALELITGNKTSQMSCHAHCGIGTYLFVNKETKECVPLPHFIDIVGVMERFNEVYQDEKNKKTFFRTKRKIDVARKLKTFEEFFDASKAPKGVTFEGIIDYTKDFVDTRGFSDNLFKRKKIKEREWNTLVITCKHFQDAHNYETERVQRCIVHYAAPNGKLYPFCTYNAGPYHRTEVEKQFSKPLK
jgi:uncharacterized radical SAM superfamily Fe-S cluster-containing enzyme